MGRRELNAVWSNRRSVSPRRRWEASRRCVRRLGAYSPVLATTSAGAVTLTLYSAQHEQTVDLLTKAFTKETGIDVKVHSGEAPELASELVKEGVSSLADVFFTENSPELELLSEKGLLTKVRRRPWRASRRPTAGRTATGSASSRARMCSTSTGHGQGSDLPPPCSISPSPSGRAGRDRADRC